MRPWLTFALSAAMLGVAGVASAHQPSFAGGNETSASSAYVLPDIEISRAIYVDSPCPAPPFWATFQGRSGDTVHFELGLPVMEGLATYRPSLALVGPGLPAPTTSLPFTLPEGYGARVFDTSAVTTPEKFDEPFSQTESWILLESREPLPVDGRYYLVVYAKEARVGRYWLAVGDEEKLDPSSIPDLGKVRSFHDEESLPGAGLACQKGTAPPPSPSQGEVPDDDTNDAPRSEAGSGCSQAGTGSPFGIAPLAVTLALTLGVARRRKRS